MFNLIDDVPRLEQASHWEVTKHHLQAAKHNISSDSLTPSGEDGHSPLVKMVRWTKMRMVKMVRWTSPFYTGTICCLIIITHYPSKIMSNKVTKRPRTKYVLGRFVAGRNGTRELWMIILMFSATCATSLDIKDKDVESICMWQSPNVGGALSEKY